MLTHLTIRNFKQFDQVDIELGETVVLIGPNNSGKTSALQALSLWELGMRRWSEKRGQAPPKERSGVTINRRDLVAVPVPATNLLWRDLHVRGGSRVGAKRTTKNIRVEIEVQGVTSGQAWSCGLEFDYANTESIYCRPLGGAAGGSAGPDAIPNAALESRIAYLPPMSGLASNEVRLEPGAVQVRLGEGRTAEVLRNLCFDLAVQNGDGAGWHQLWQRVKDLFGVEVDRPEHIVERGELAMAYRDRRGVKLDMSAAGRGLQQTLLLLAFLLRNPGAVLLLDEPDAHLEILRQRQIYQALTEVAGEAGSQVIAASHSEVILNEAADRDVVVAFVGKPHRIDDRGSQVLKSLKSIGFESYYLAETTGWVLYLEGATDLAILRAFARTLKHAAAEALERPFTHYIQNLPQHARDHFYGVREAKADLVGLVITDKLERDAESTDELTLFHWSRREIENYLCFPEVLASYAVSLARQRADGPLFEGAAAQRFRHTMRECVEGRVPPLALRNDDDRWWRTVKASDEFLDLVFEDFFQKLELPNLMRKTDYHRLAALVPAERIDEDVRRALDLVVKTSGRARPVSAGTEE
jgi:ABC-type arginine transport system ATPase subunit